MKTWMKLGSLLSGILAVALLPCAGADDRKEDKKDDKKPEAKEGIVIIDARGKENKIKNWEIVAGTRRLGWLAPPLPEEKPEGKDDPDAPPKRPLRPAAPRGPEALVFRDENSTVWKDGVLTLIPLERIRAIDYDNEKETVTVKVAGAKTDDDVSLTGTTEFAGTNKLTIEAEVDKGDLGVAAVKYLGGVKNGIKGIRFPSPKAGAAPAGRTAQVTILQDKNKKTTEKVTDLQALYLTGGGEKLSPILLFKKTIKLDVAKTTKLAVADTRGKEWTVTLKDGNEETLTLLDQGDLDGKLSRLEALVAKVPGGWKLYPLLTIAEISFEDAKPDSKP
jgi:hypothetical protein